MMSKRNWAKLHFEWYRDPVLRAAGSESPSVFALWPVLIARAKAQSHDKENPHGCITTGVDELAFDICASHQEIEGALESLEAGELISVERPKKHELKICLITFSSWQAPRYSDRERKQIERAFAGKKGSYVTEPSEHVTKTETETETNNSFSKEKPPSSADQYSDEIKEIFDYWQQVTGKHRAKLTDKRKNKIRARLKDGYSVDEIKRAIDGYVASPFHNGSKNGRRYLDLDLICRNDDKIEAGLEMAVKHERQHNSSALGGITDSELSELGTTIRLD